MYIYRTAHQSGQILQREFPAWPHSSVRTQSSPCSDIHHLLLASRSSPPDDSHLRLCMSSCLLLRADVYLPHPPAIGGGLGPRRWLIRPILRGGFPGGPLPSSYLDSEGLPGPLLFFTSCWSRVLKKKTTNSAIPQKKSVMKDNLHGDWFRLSNTWPFEM